MENTYYCIAFLLSAVLIFKHFFHHKRRLPPSPLALPVIGHLYLMKQPLYQSLDSLSSQYGPILFLRSGWKSFVVVSSPSAVDECFTKNDIIFANRPKTMVGDLFTYNYTTFVFAAYGHLWRCLRRVAVVELFSSNSLHKSSIIREEEIRASLLKQLFRVSKNGSQKVDLKYWFSILTLNIMMRMINGKQCVREEEAGTEVGKQVLEEIKGKFFASAVLNVCDFFPILRWIGFKGLEKKMMGLHKNRDEVLQGLIDEFRREKSNASDTSAETKKEKKKTLVETLLSIQGSDPDFYSDEVLKSIIMIMFVAGTETSTTTLEWAMSLLLSHPEAYRKLTAEIDCHVGNGRLLNDLDLTKLPYLHCVVSETLRLYPPAPLLLPHCSSEDCTIGEYEIPRGTILLVNAWAMHRDPKEWEDANKFKPERFEGMEGERQEFKFIPFGMGRRACPGANMGVRTVSLALGALIQCFEWAKVGPDKMEICRCGKPMLHRAKALEAVCHPRQNFVEVLSQL